MRTNILAKEGYGSFEVGTAIPMGNDNIGNTVSKGPAVTYDEGNGTGPDTIVMTGPLGEVYTKALSIHFAKTPLENVLVQETQAMDAAYQTAAISDNVELGLKEIADAVQLKTSNDEILGNVSATVFAVDQTMMNRPEVIDAVEKLRDKAEAQGIDYVMAVCVDPLRNISPVYMDSNSTYYGIHDHTVNAENAGKIFNRATECYCASQGMNVVFGMEGLAIWLTDKYKGKANYAQEGFLNWYKNLFQKDDQKTKELIASVINGRLVGKGKDTPWHKEAIKQVDYLNTTFNFLTDLENKLNSLSEDDKGHDTWQDFGNKCPIQINRGQRITYLGWRKGFDINESVAEGKEFWNIKDSLSENEAKDLAKKLERLISGFKIDIFKNSLIDSIDGPFSNTNLQIVSNTLNNYITWLKNSVTAKDSGDTVTTEGYAQEGFTGFLAGFFSSGFVGLPGLSTAVGAGVKAMLESKKREIEKVAGEIQKLKLQGAKAALDQGRISEGRYKTETKMEVPDIIEGAILGTIPFVASIYNGVNASKLQDASEDLNKKIRKLEELMRAHGIDGKKKSKDDGDHEYR